MRFSPLPLAAALLALSAPAAAAQIVDEGTFMISRNGTPAGIETFRITRSAGEGGELIRATGLVSLDDRRINAALVTGPTGTPVTYDLSVRARNTVLAELTARVRSNRLAVLVRHRETREESMKEFPLPPAGAVVLDSGFVHQYFFLGLGSRSGTVRTIEPWTGREATETIRVVGSETLEIAGQTVNASRLAIGNGVARELWFDRSGRLLRVVVPSQGLIAVRDELPR